MTELKQVFEYLNSLAPVTLKMDFDNVGLLAGNSGVGVTKILVALDITDEVIDEAINLGAELIVSHHPLMFSVKCITDNDIRGRRIIKLLSNGIAAICMHTNLDKAQGGVNDALAEAVGLHDLSVLGETETDQNGNICGLGRIGELPEAMQLTDYLKFVKANLKCEGIRYHDSGRCVKRVAVLGGSGGDHLMNAVESGCDTFITADIKYDVFLDAKALGINLIDGDHFCTENVVIKVLQDKLQDKFREITVEVSAIHTQTAKFM